MKRGATGFRWADHIALSDHMTTWAFADIHGVRSGLLSALVAAGVVNAAGDWIAPAGTQLVGLGDYIDRGTDSLGVLELLWHLQQQAPDSGGRVMLLRGNHEELLLGAVMGDAATWQVWLSDFAGGEAFLRSLGTDPSEIRAEGPASLRAALADRAPELYDRIRSMPEWAMWGRHTFLAHAGFPPHRHPDLLEAGGDHLWQEPRYERASDPAWNLDGPAFDAARGIGIERIVYGHRAQPGEVRLDQGGRALCLDTNAAALPLLDNPLDSGAAVALARLPPEGSLSGSEFVVIDTREAPDRWGADGGSRAR